MWHWTLLFLQLILDEWQKTGATVHAMTSIFLKK